MKTVNQILISKESGKLQMPYKDYVAIMEQVKAGERMRLVKDQVLVSLQGFLDGTIAVAEVSAKIENARTDLKKVDVEAHKPEEPAAEEKVSVEFEPDEPVAEPAPATRAVPDGVEVPPIKKDISVHFNKLDDSGRLFSVFKQYYACLNDACGGTVRVTMKDGICSLWNYDEWEEFAFIDMVEGMLRISVDPRYTDALESLNLCEVPRLLSSRHNLICVQVDDLNNTLLKVLIKAFEEVGLTAG